MLISRKNSETKLKPESKKEETPLESILHFLQTIICFLMTTDTIALKSICLKADKFLIIGTQ